MGAQPIKKVFLACCVFESLDLFGVGRSSLVCGHHGQHAISVSPQVLPTHHETPFFRHVSAPHSSLHVHPSEPPAGVSKELDQNQWPLSLKDMLLRIERARAKVQTQIRAKEGLTTRVIVTEERDRESNRLRISNNNSQ